MTVSSLNVLRQRRVIGALARTVTRSALRRPRAAAVPGPKISATAPAPAPALIEDFLRVVGGDPALYRGRVPPQLFPQWAFPVMLRALEAAPYPPARTVNAGCSLEVFADIPAGEPLRVTAQLVSIDETDTRALLTVEVVTGALSAPEALRASFRALVPLGRRSVRPQGGDRKRDRGSGRAGEKHRIPTGAREVAYLSLPKSTGLEFAKVTGDFNPIHWLPRYARAMGFRNVILHGFGSMAFATEGLNRGLFAGNTRRLRRFDATFARPLVLPATVGLYVWGERQVGLGDAPGGPAYLTGRFDTT